MKTQRAKAQSNSSSWLPAGELAECRSMYRPRARGGTNEQRTTNLQSDLFNYDAMISCGHVSSRKQQLERTKRAETKTSGGGVGWGEGGVT